MIIPAQSFLPEGLGFHSHPRNLSSAGYQLNSKKNILLKHRVNKGKSVIIKKNAIFTISGGWSLDITNLNNSFLRSNRN